MGVGGTCPTKWHFCFSTDFDPRNKSTVAHKCYAAAAQLLNAIHWPWTDLDGQTDRLRVSISRDDKAMIHMTGYESGINFANIIIVVSGLDTHNAHSDQGSGLWVDGPLNGNGVVWCALPEFETFPMNRAGWSGMLN